MFYIYIIYSEQLNKYYVGYSSDIRQRLNQHNCHHKGFTGSASDWRLMYSESYEMELDARKREKQIKSWKSRRKIEELIKL
ncbi:MAG: GIY-YIG nuclease family protein [Salinivirgaceae bacterium]|jgi:putative endonuclease|nr:GIY-YIG nuclease family protein [Salinivirgaceae bacterium]